MSSILPPMQFATLIADLAGVPCRGVGSEEEVRVYEEPRNCAVSSDKKRSGKSKMTMLRGTGVI